MIFLSLRKRLRCLFGRRDKAHGHPRPGSVASPETPSPVNVEFETLEQVAPLISSGSIQRVTTDVSPSLPAASIPQQSDTTSSQWDQKHGELWDKALTQLTEFEENQSIIDSAREIAKELVLKIETSNDQSSTVKSLADSIKEVMEVQIKRRQHNGNMDRFLEKAVSVLNKFVAAGDVAVSFDPVHAALPWAAVRFVIVSLTASSELKSQLLGGIANATSLVMQCHTYQQLYITPDPLLRPPKNTLDALETSVVQSYVSTLLFLGFAMYCQQSWSKIGSAPFQLGDMEKYVKSLAESESQLAEAADNCEKHCNHHNQARVRELVGLMKELHLFVLATTSGVKQEIHKIDHSMLLNQLPAVAGAAFDSHAEEHNEICLQNTRVELLRQISGWARDPHAKAVFWLNGMAGTGKSTISRTVAKSFAETGCLGASFFFKRGETDRNSVSKFVTTIAAQLVHRKPSVALHIQNAIDANPAIFDKAIQEQFKKLILEPLSMVPPDTRAVVTLVVDALDECESDNDVKRLIYLFSLAKSLKSLHLRIFVTSRPDLPIRLGFSNEDVKGTYESLILHDISEEIIERDLVIFLNHEVTRIKNSYNESVSEDRRLPVDWPGESNIQTLVNMAIPLFIFAAIVCRFLDDRNCGSPRKQLEDVLAYETRSQESKLDQTYMPVLKRQLINLSTRQKDKVLEEFRNIVGPIVVLASPLSACALANLLDFNREIVDHRLDLLHSVLNIPSSSDYPIRLFHLSFRDFLLDPEKRGEDFWVDEKDVHKRLANDCFRIMNKSLQTNICGIEAPGTLISFIEPQKIHDGLRPEVQYACRYWSYHLQQASTPILDDEVYAFLHRHFLHWLEALSLMGEASESLSIIKTLQGLVQFSQIFQFLDDAGRFIVSAVSIIQQAPLQIYSSALAFTPKSSIIRSVFEYEIPGWISLLPKVEDNWSHCLQTLEGHSHFVNAVAFSPDSKLLASASHDETVRIWSAETGACQQTLEVHSSVRSVVFSPDSKLVASASWDKSVRIWSAETGACQQTLKGHSHFVNSVAFSPDSKLMASASWDNTIRIWSAETGACQQTLKGHSGFVNSAAFSPDSKLVASASRDKTVRIWSAKTGACQQTLEGHNGSVNSVAFSPDLKLMASASHDDTVRLWSAETGACKQTLKGHSHFVNSVAFSPDSKLVASASWDNTVRFWSAETGACQQTLEGHSNSVNSVAFLPDSKLMASASHDNTVRIWSTETGAYQQALESHEGHNGSVNSVTFSPDSKLVASASHDNTIRIWSAETGVCQQTFEGHSGSVNAVAFSPDSKLVASVSWDKTVRIWLAETGACQQAFEGHGSSVNAVAFSPDSKLVASASHDETVRIWLAETGACQQTLQGHSDSVNSVAFSPDSKLVASASWDKTVRIWSVETGACQQTLEGHGSSVNVVAFSPDSKLVASASHDEKVRIWWAETGACQQTFRIGFQTSSLAFDLKRLHLYTDSGVVSFENSLRPMKASDSPTKKSPGTVYQSLASDNPNYRSGYGISTNGSWITTDGYNLLWLPVNYRPGCLALYHSTVVLGSGAGHVTIMRFSA